MKTWWNHGLLLETCCLVSPPPFTLAQLQPLVAQILQSWDDTYHQQIVGGYDRRTWWQTLEDTYEEEQVQTDNGGAYHLAYQLAYQFYLNKADALWASMWWWQNCRDWIINLTASLPVCWNAVRHVTSLGQNWTNHHLSDGRGVPSWHCWLTCLCRSCTDKAVARWVIVSCVISTFICCKINVAIQILSTLFSKTLVLLWPALIVVPQIMNDSQVFSIQSQLNTLIHHSFCSIMTARSVPSKLSI